MSIDPADTKNKKAIISHFLKYYNADNLNIDSIVKLLEEEENKKRARYDNEIIVKLAKAIGKRIQSGTIKPDNIMEDLRENIIPYYQPELDKDTISKFQKEYDILIKDCEGD